MAPTQELIACILKRERCCGVLKEQNHKEEKFYRGRSMKMPQKESEKSALLIAEINRATQVRKA